MFRNRGNLPNININAGENKGIRGGYNVPHYYRYWNGRMIVVQYDKNFIAIEVISALILLLIILAVYLFVYQVTFEDPIKTIKSSFLTAQLVTICISIALTGLVTVFSKSKETLIGNLRIVAMISILMIAVVLGIKLHMDNKYNEETFGQFYETYEQTEDIANEKSKKISIGLSGVKMLNLKESYVKDSVNAYTNFKLKTTLYIIIHMFVVMIIFYLISRLSSIERKKQQLAKDDAILYDEEENIKI